MPAFAARLANSNKVALTMYRSAYTRLRDAGISWRASGATREAHSLATAWLVRDQDQLASSHTGRVDEEERFTVTLDLYESVVNSVRYRERGHRDDWLIGDLYVKNQALPERPPGRIEVTVAYR